MNRFLWFALGVVTAGMLLRAPAVLADAGLLFGSSGGVPVVLATDTNGFVKVHFQ